jgi:hypothetical protein
MPSSNPGADTVHPKYFPQSLYSVTALNRLRPLTVPHFTTKNVLHPRVKPRHTNCTGKLHLTFTKFCKSQYSVNSSIPASVQCTDLQFFTRCRSRCTISSWTYIKRLQNPAVLGSSLNLNRNAIRVISHKNYTQRFSSVMYFTWRTKVAIFQKRQSVKSFVRSVACQYATLFSIHSHSVIRTCIA